MAVMEICWYTFTYRYALCLQHPNGIVHIYPSYHGFRGVSASLQVYALEMQPILYALMKWCLTLGHIIHNIRHGRQEMPYKLTAIPLYGTWEAFWDDSVKYTYMYDLFVEPRCILEQVGPAMLLLV